MWFFFHWRAGNILIILSSRISGRDRGLGSRGVARPLSRATRWSLELDTLMMLRSRSRVVLVGRARGVCAVCAVELWRVGCRVAGLGSADERLD